MFSQHLHVQNNFDIYCVLGKAGGVMRNKRFVKYFELENGERFKDLVNRINTWIECNEVIVLNLDRMERYAFIVFYEKRENR